MDYPPYICVYIINECVCEQNNKRAENSRSVGRTDINRAQTSSSIRGIIDFEENALYRYVSADASTRSQVFKRACNKYTRIVHCTGEGARADYVYTFVYLYERISYMVLTRTRILIDYNFISKSLSTRGTRCFSASLPLFLSTY